MASSILSDNGVSSGSAGIKTTADSTGALALQTTTAGGAATTALTIDTSQGVGVGMATPRNFEVARSDANTSFGAAAAQYPVNIRNTDTTANNWASIGFNQGASSLANPVSIGAQFASTTAASFVVATSGAERMRIDSSGNVLLGQTTSNNARLQITQTNTATESVTFANSSASPYGLGITFSGADPNNATNYIFAGYDSFASVFMYRIYSNGTVAARSDARWKKNIETARNGYAEDLSRLRVVKYNWYNQDDGAPKELGFIAQEVEQVFPNLVQTDPVMKKREVTDEHGNITEEEYQDGTSKSIKVSVLTPMLVKAIQELKTLVDTQASTITALTARITALENKT